MMISQTGPYKRAILNESHCKAIQHSNYSEDDKQISISLGFRSTYNGRAINLPPMWSLYE
jgi:hypothetical protein